MSIGWALAGTGAIARRRMAPAIAAHPGSRIVAVVSASPERAERFAVATGAARACTALDEALADDRVEAVYVSTTNELHAEQSIACLRAGRHVLCEKPLALTLDDADAMIAAAAAAGTTLAVNHHLRAAAGVTRIRALLAAGAVGAPRLVRTLHRCHVRPERRAGWRMTDPARGAGAILDLSVHTADALRFMCDREIAAVTALADPAGFGREEIAGAVAGAMRLEGGLLAAFADGYSALPALSAVEVHGDEGSLSATGVLDGGGSARIAVDGRRPIAIDRDDPYARTVERFAAAVRGEGAPAATGDDGRRALAAALALRRYSRAPWTSTCRPITS